MRKNLEKLFVVFKFLSVYIEFVSQTNKFLNARSNFKRLEMSKRHFSHIISYRPIFVNIQIVFCPQNSLRNRFANIVLVARSLYSLDYRRKFLVSYSKLFSFTIKQTSYIDRSFVIRLHSSVISDFNFSFYAYRPAIKAFIINSFFLARATDKNWKVRLNKPAFNRFKQTSQSSALFTNWKQHMRASDKFSRFSFFRAAHTCSDVSPRLIFNLQHTYRINCVKSSRSFRVFYLSANFIKNH